MAGSKQRGWAKEKDTGECADAAGMKTKAQRTAQADAEQHHREGMKHAGASGEGKLKAMNLEEISDADDKARRREIRNYYKQKDIVIEELKNRTRRHLVRKLEDIPVYTIGADCGEKAYHKLMIKRYKRLRAVGSTSFYGKPVTPLRLTTPSNLSEEIDTFHIVKLVGKNREDNCSSVHLMFRESDFYFVAFTPDDINNQATWFTFEDCPIPSYLKQIRLTQYDCSYKDISKIPVGHLCLNHIVEVLSEFNPQNAYWDTDERKQTLQCVALMLSEPSRSGELQIYMKFLLRTKREECIPQFNTKIHNWGKLGRHSFRHECGEEDILAGCVNIIPGLYNQEKEMFEIWKAIGRQSPSLNKKTRFGKGMGEGMLITLFDIKYTTNYLVHKKGYLPAKQKENTSTGILDRFSEGPSKGVKMSERALKDLNISQSVDLGKGEDNSVNCITKPALNGKKEENALSAFQDSVTNGNTVVEYIASENLADLPDVNAALSTLATRLDSKDWVMTCEALNNVRQLAMYHKERLQELLEPLVPLIVKSLKNKRRVVWKTAMMTCADIFKAYGDLMVDSIDPLLVQLFLKASRDKRLVCEAAEAALTSLTTCISPSLLLSRMEPYLESRNPHIRAKASVCIYKTVSRLDVVGIKKYGMDNLIHIAAKQLTDKLPESREAARDLALELQVFYEKSQASPDAESWKTYCESKLSALSAKAILRVTSGTKKGVASTTKGVTAGCKNKPRS